MKKLKLILAIIMTAVFTYAGVDYSCTGKELYPFGKQWNEYHHNAYRNQLDHVDMRMVLYFQTFVENVAVEAVKKKKANIPEDVKMVHLHKTAWEALHNNRDRHKESAAKLIIEALKKKYPKKK